MRYEEENEKIHISVRELVTTARRGIATSLPCDESEPELSKIPKGLRKKIIGDCEPQKVSHCFSAEEFAFEASATIDKVDKCELWFISSVDRNPKKPKKECTAQLRGEAYIAAFGVR